MHNTNSSLFNRLNKQVTSSKYLGLKITIFLIFICLIQFFLYPVCKGYDFNYHYNRFYTLFESLRDGTFPIYMDYYVLDGYGYLVKNFYSDFLFIPFAILSFLTGVTQAFNIMVIVSTFFCGLFCFYGYKAIQKNIYGALIFTLLFTTMSYRLFDLYQRGAYGEGLAITFLPLVFWGLYEALVGNYKKFYILAIGMSLLIYTHALTTSIVILCCFISSLCCIKNLIKDKSRLKYFISAILTTIFLTSYYWIPYMEMILNDTYKFSIPMFGQLYTDKFGFVFGGIFRLFEHPTAAYSPKLGLLTVFPAILLRCLVSRKEYKLIRKTDPFLCLALVLIVMCTHLFPWQIFPFTLFAYIQFSYRFFPFISLLLFFCTATYLVILANNFNKKIMSFGVLLFCVLLALSGESTYYTYFTCRNSVQLIDVDTKHSALLGGEFLPLNFNDSTDYHTNTRGRYTIEFQNTDSKITEIEKAKGRLSFNLELNKPDTLVLPLTYYLGYEIQLNNQKIHYASTDGLITIYPTESGHVTTKYIGSSLQIISFWISIISFLLLFIFIIFPERNKMKLTKVIKSHKG